VLVDSAGRINAIIDWENAVAAPAPEWELALALHDLSIDEKDAFLDGYGLEAADLVATRAALAALNMLHYAAFAERGAQAGNDQRMRHYRRRFARVYEFLLRRSRPQTASAKAPGAIYSRSPSRGVMLAEGPCNRFGAGPFSPLAPVASNREPWHGQSHVLSATFHRLDSIRGGGTNR
jgi:hypothetical protein